MSDLQATVEFSIELHKFYNVDLFQRGFYQVRAGLKVSPKLSVKIEVNLAKNQKSDQVLSPFITNGFGVSRTFQILYRNQEVLLDNVILFRVHILVDSHKVEEILERADFALSVELWYTEQPYLLTQPSGINCVSMRTLHFNFSPIKGLHYHLPVLFDYFHLAAVTVTIHAILVALHQPYINTPRGGKPLFRTHYRIHSSHAQSIDSLFFGTTNSTKCVSSGSRLAYAKHVHQEVCSILLTTYNKLQSNLQDYMKLLPSWQQLKLETSDRWKRLNTLSKAAKLIEAEEDFVSVANSNIAQLCAENILLWQQFLEAFTSKVPILQHLAKCHHQLRVKRFSEAFFVVDNPRQSAAGCYDANYQNYLAISETVRRSKYLASLPPLPVTCVELDGDITTMPVIFEDQYHRDMAEYARRRNDGSKKTGNDSFFDLLVKRAVSEKDCSCGIVAILEARSQKNTKNVTSSAQPVTAKKSNSQFSLELFKTEKNGGEEDGVVKATLTLGSAKKNAGPMTNTSTLLFRNRENKDRKVAEVESGKALPARHSKSLDQLKNAGLFQAPRTAAPSAKRITRSTSSQMPGSVPPTILQTVHESFPRPLFGSLVENNHEGNNGNNNKESSSTDSGDTESSTLYKPIPINSPYNSCEDAIFFRSGRFRMANRLKRSASTMSMPNGSEGDRFEDAVHPLMGRNSESMPNLTQVSPTESPLNFTNCTSRFKHRKANGNRDMALYENDNSTILEEPLDQYSLCRRKSPKRKFSLSSPISSISDDVTSEQSGWVSNSSRHSSCSRSSSGAISPEVVNSRLRVPVNHAKVPEEKAETTGFDGDALIRKLKKLAADDSSDRKKAHRCEDVRLPPPHQFRDVPSPPENFRDPPAAPATQNRLQQSRKISVDNFLYHLYDFGLEKHPRKGASSTENLFEHKDLKLREKPCGKKNRRKSKGERKSRVTSDEGFEEPEVKYNGNEIGEDSAEEDDVEIGKKEKNPFEGYLFKEDIETLKKTLGKTEKGPKEREKERAAVKEEGSGQEKSGATCGKHGPGKCDCQEKAKERPEDEETITFMVAKEEFKRQMNFAGAIYSDFPTLASTLPYFHISDEYRIFSPEGVHLIVCVHGLDGNSNDLRLVKTYVELGLPGANLEFLMSERNQGDTFSDFETMTDKLVSEILYHIKTCGPTPSKISFIGHSLGNIIIRSAITRPQLKHLLPRFHTLLSLSGPHLGTLYNNSGLINMGMWFMQKWKKSGSLLQLSLKDAADVRKTFLYRLSQKSNLHHFKHVLLCGSSQDRYVPMHSARIELCKAAIKDTTVMGAVYREMVHNIMYPVINSSDTTLVRYDVHHALPSTANSLIGRAAHIAVLDSELFIEKFLVVTGLKYFR